MKQVTIRKKCTIVQGCDGEFRATGMGTGNNIGTSWEHKCSKCDSPKYYDNTYPRIVLEFEEHEKEERWE